MHNGEHECLSNIMNLHKGFFHCHNIPNKHSVLKAACFQNVLFVLNIVTVEKSL